MKNLPDKLCYFIQNKICMRICIKLKKIQWTFKQILKNNHIFVRIIVEFEEKFVKKIKKNLHKKPFKNNSQARKFCKFLLYCINFPIRNENIKIIKISLKNEKRIIL